MYTLDTIMRVLGDEHIDFLKLSLGADQDMDIVLYAMEKGIKPTQLCMITCHASDAKKRLVVDALSQNGYSMLPWLHVKNRWTFSCK
jgi:hypothetical protein